MQLYARFDQCAPDDRERVPQPCAVDEQRLRRVARRRILRLCVHRDTRRHLCVAVRVHIDMADAVAVTQHGDSAVLHDIADERIRAARNDEVDFSVHAKHNAHILARRQQAAPALRQTAPDARIAQNAEEHLIGVQRFPTALEQDSIAALEAQTANLNQCVRTRFKDDADHADGGS